MPKNSGKDKGSITQKAQDQDVRISQVSNVSRAVSEMGRKTTREMQETERRISSGGDSKEIAGSMNSVLGSLKRTIDSLERGVEAATLGTAKAAQEAISQYGKAIQEDININKQNMVASSLASATPMLGYFASKLLETGVFKKAQEKMSQSMSRIFQRKSKGGSIPDEFEDGGGSIGPGMGPLTPAQAKSKAMKERVLKKEDTLSTMRLANRDKYEKYDKTTEEKTLLALGAIQTALGAEFGKFKVWYDKFLLEHPTFRKMTTAYKAISATMGAAWKAVYFFWRPRGGYKKHLSKAKNPLEAMNQNIGALFVQTMPRLDAIMIYTKATAQATRDLSSHVTGIKYAKMDPSKLGGTWSIAGVGMKIMKAVGRGITGGVRNFLGSKFSKKQLPTLGPIFDAMVQALYYSGQFTGYMLEGPGELKKKIVAALPSSKEKKRLFGGLSGVGVAPEKPKGPVRIPGPESLTEWSSRMRGGDQKKIKGKEKIRAPKYFKGMGRRQKPHIITQGVYDQLIVQKETKREKDFKKLIGYTANSAKYLKAHDRREKRKGVLGFLGGIFKGAKDIVGSGLGMLSGLFGGGGGFFSKLLMNPLFWKATGIVAAIVGGIKLWDWLDKKYADSDSIGGSMWRGFKTAFPAVDMTLSVKEGIMGGISRMFRGEEFDAGKVFKESIEGFLDRKFGQFGVGFKDWWKAITGKATKEELREINDKMMKKTFGEDALAIEVKARRAAKAKGFKENLSTRWDLYSSALKSKLGMDVEESKLDITRLRAQKFVDKYGGRVEDYMDLTVEQGHKLGKVIKEKYQKVKPTIDNKLNIAKNFTTGAGKLITATAREWAEKKGFKIEGSGGRLVAAIESKFGAGQQFTADQWEKAKQWADKNDLVIEGSGGRLMDAAKRQIKKSGEYIELGKGNFIEIYRQGSGKIKDMWETASPDKKIMLKQKIQELLATGEMTKEELEKMGIKLVDSASKATEKVGEAVTTAAVYTTNNISNAVSTVNSSGGGGNSNKFLQEKTMDDITMGEVLF